MRSEQLDNEPIGVSSLTQIKFNAAINSKEQVCPLSIVLNEESLEYRKYEHRSHHTMTYIYAHVCPM